MSTLPEPPDPAQRARELRQEVTRSWHADAHPEAAYPDLAPSVAARATEARIVRTQTAYDQHLSKHRAELAGIAEFAHDYAALDAPPFAGIDTPPFPDRVRGYTWHGLD
ncbi:hypothetical protein [Nocardia sp. NBC_01327]|uniref:hypothetical protein n=1 Tax=Nocardia sp. NBC_01327 TaxID=2903593 RepID=UPI002E0E3C39|nr:hypothetical protein OG326_42390 [Nocardia sp. NBC_01327]